VATEQKETVSQRALALNAILEEAPGALKTKVKKTRE
jgi:hypothetical protein